MPFRYEAAVDQVPGRFRVAVFVILAVAVEQGEPCRVSAAVPHHYGVGVSFNGVYHLVVVLRPGRYKAFAVEQVVVGICVGYAPVIVVVKMVFPGARYRRDSGYVCTVTHEPVAVQLAVV